MFGLAVGENLSQRRLYNGVRLWFTVNNSLLKQMGISTLMHSCNCTAQCKIILGVR